MKCESHCEREIELILTLNRGRSLEGEWAWEQKRSGWGMIEITGRENWNLGLQYFWGEL